MGSRIRLVAALGVALGMATLAGCSEDDDGNVTGTWVLDLVDFDRYLRITSSTWDAYRETEDCVEHSGLDVIDVDGDVWTLAERDQPATTYEVELRRVGSSLMIRGPEGDAEVTYEATSVDVGDFELCPDVGP